MTMFTDDYRTDLAQYDYCGKDHLEEEAEQELEQEMERAIEWLSFHE